MSVDLNRLTAHLSPQQQDAVKKAYHRQEEHSTAAFLYCFFLGIFGAHRFYLRQWGKGFAHLIIPVIIAVAVVAGLALNWPTATIALVVIPLLVIALIWEILDLFTIDAEVYRRNLKLAEQLVAQSLLADTTVEQRGQAKLEAMLQSDLARSAASAQEERVASDTAASAAAAVDDAATLPMAAGAELEAATASELRDGAAGATTDQYAETTVTQISEDPAARNGEPEHTDQPPAPASWSVTETVHGDDTAVAGATAAGEEAIVSANGMGIAEDERTEAVADSAEYTETVTRAHEESAYSVTDSVEHVQTYAAAEATDTAETVAAEAAETPEAPEAAAAVVEAPPTYAEAIAPTWPNYPPIEDVAAVAAGAAAAAAAAPAPPEPATSTPPAPRDVTDLGATYGDVKPLADIVTEGGQPQRVVLPGADDVLVGMGALGALGMQSVIAEPAVSPVLTPVDSPVVSAATDTPAAGDESVLVFVPEPEPEEAAPTSAAAEAAPAGPSLSAAEQAGIAGMAALAAAGTYAALTGDMRTPAPAPAPAPAPEQPVAPQRETPAAPQGETLAELAGYGAGPLVESVEHTPPPAPAAEFEPAPAPAAAPEPEYHETHTDELAHSHHSMRRIRVVRQVKVGDQVVEETAAEEFIEADADPEPVRLRLQEMLRQQAASKQQANPGNA